MRNQSTEFHRQSIIRDLQRQRFFLARDGRLLSELSLEELQVEKVRLPELRDCGQ